MYPKVRFRGFDEPWKKVKLGQIADVRDGTHESPKYVSQNGYPLITSKNLENGTINFDDISYISKKDYEEINKRSLVEKNDILFGMIGTIGNVAIVKKSGFAIKNVALIKSNSEIPSINLIQIIQSDIFKKYTNRLNSGNSQKFISLGDIRKFDFKMASKSENMLISKLFKKVDTLLSLQQRKLELENQLKQFNLQNLFSDEQRLYPKVRFRGFDEPWKKVKLGRNVKRIRRKNKNLETNIPLTISAQFGLVDQRDFFGRVVASENLANYILLKRGEFAYNKSYSKEAPYGSIKRLEKYNEGALSTLYIAFTPENINSDFLKAFFDTTKWYSHIVQVSTEGARNHGLLNISPQDFFEMSITIPKSDEQNNISRIYNLMNSLLSLQQQDINTTQQLKQFLLQNLFI
ncbi:restriction endonuclease subunit S [Lactobacillus mulieris]|nr:restriction endonuclease subunit S [Lactobacillus jensenii]